MKQDIKKYDIVIVDFGVNVGSEQEGIRPAVVVQNDKGNFFSTTTLVIPMTTSFIKHKIPTHALIKKGEGKGLKENSIVLAECLRQVSEERIEKIIGRITDPKEQNAIRVAYLNSLGE